MVYFEYGSKEIEYLKRKDKRLAKAMERIGMVERETIPDLFSALIGSIVSQQISSKAVDTIWKRFLSRYGTITPEGILKDDIETIQKLGISMDLFMGNLG